MKRREFIKTTAVAAAGVGLAACAGSCTGSTSRKGQDPDFGGEKAPVQYKPAGERMKLSWEPYELQLEHPFGVSAGTRTTTPDVQVKIEYDGFTGYGEASMPPYLGHTVQSVCDFLQKVNLEQFSDPFCIEDIMDYVNKIAPGNDPAKAAVDIALHDLVGKLMGQPLWRIWGINASKTPNTTFTIGIDEPEVMKQKTLEAAGRFKILKVKVGTPNDQRNILAIRSVTDLPLAVDANRGWTDKFDALAELYWLKDQGVVMVEQPMRSIADNAWLTERSPLPIYADESVQHLEDIKRIRGAFNGINIKLMKCGGLLEARRMVEYARLSGLKVMVGCMTETSCAVTAAAQLSPLADFADLDGNLLITNDRFRGVTLENGRLILPDTPGIGIRRI